MGPEVKFNNYSSMRDANRDSNGITSLPRGETVLPNGQYRQNSLHDTFPGGDKELVKRKMLEHEAVFRSQVYELHRVYRVQKELMDEAQRNEQNGHRALFEASSSSSPLPPQIVPVSDSGYVLSGNKGKNASGASPRDSLVSDARPSKLKKVIDLELPAEEYMDLDEVEQCGKGMSNGGGEKLFPKSALVDLNKPLEIEETEGFRNKAVVFKPTPSEAVSRRPEHGSANGTGKSSHYGEKGNENNWLVSMSKPDGSKDKGKAVYQPGSFPPKGSFGMPDTSSVSSIIIQESRHANSMKSRDTSNHMPKSVQKAPFLGSAVPSKTSQSSVPSGFQEAWWTPNDMSGSKTPVKNGFYYGASFGLSKGLHASLSRAAPEYLSGSFATSVSSLLKGTSSSSFDLNAPDGSSNFSIAKRAGSISVPPWLRAATVTSHRNSVSSSSSTAKKILEKESEKKRVLIDINLPCDDPEEFETARPKNGLLMIDLNSSFVEDEIPSESSRTNSTMKKPDERGVVIDLDELPPSENRTDSSDKQLAIRAAKALIDISNPAPENEDALHWLADLACNFPENDDVEYISSDAESFEEMSLRLTESSVEEYFPNPPKFDTLFSEKPRPAVNLRGRGRRGPSKRGRHRCDFQRDILPGLTTLSRNEITEDLQTFGSLMRASGQDWHFGSRRTSSGRGRRKAVVEGRPPPAPVADGSAFSERRQDRSFTGWGKTTRRPRRPRGGSVGAGTSAGTPLRLTS